jgi:hypothetical protein
VCFSTNDHLSQSLRHWIGCLLLPFFYGYRTSKRGPKEPQRSTESIDLVLSRVPPCEIIDQGFARKELRCEIQIFARPERLWQVLVKNQKISAKDIQNISKTKRGFTSPRKVFLSLVGKRGIVSRVALTRLSPNSELGWKQRKLFIPGLLQIETIFEIIPHVEESGTTVVCREIFTGCLVPFMRKAIQVARTDIQLEQIELREKAESIE